MMSPSAASMDIEAMITAITSDYGRRTVAVADSKVSVAATLMGAVHGDFTFVGCTFHFNLVLDLSLHNLSRL